ncbi:duboraya isoform X3 [Anarhichas minor]|uniref:duboraya isoform X3 n=1 Tax=Anarhichas minor TaxID=65739 RepID=UPI003F737027
MEEEAASRRSVAELAGRFKGSSRPHDAAGNETEKPVRRRPPRSLQLPKTTGDDQEQPPGVTSPLPAKAKRNSALIEKLQANLALSPTTLLPSPKSPGFKLLPPAFTPPSPGSAPVFGVFSSTPPPASPLNTTSPWTEEEGPASFEAPPTVEEGSILSNTSIKGRARHSIRRRPPSRRRRTSSSGDEVGVAIEGEEATEAEDKSTTTTTTGGGETDEGKEDKTDKSHEEDESEINDETRGDDEKKEERSKGEGSSSGRKEEEEEEEKNSEEKQTEDSTEGKTNTKSTDEEKKEETTSQSPAR